MTRGVRRLQMIISERKNFREDHYVPGICPLPMTWKLVRPERTPNSLGIFEGTEGNVKVLLKQLLCQHDNPKVT